MSQELVSIVNGIPTTTSLQVASAFGKRHDSVIRGVKTLIANCPKEFTDHNFVDSEYTDPTGRKVPMYLLTRDGMTLLVMGYTGKEAMKYKLAYIEAFNAMEAQIKRNVLSSADNSSAVAPTFTPSTPASRKPLATLVSTWVTVSGLKHAQCWAQVNSYFQIRKISELPDEWLPDALRFVQHQIDTAQSAPKALPYDLPDRYKDLTGIIQGLHGLINSALLDKQGYRACDRHGEQVANAYNAMTYLAANNLHAACAALTSVKVCLAN